MGRRCMLLEEKMIKKNENTAELIGLSFGDGGLTYRKNSNRVKFQLRGHLTEDKEHYDSYIIFTHITKIINFSKQSFGELTP